MDTFYATLSITEYSALWKVFVIIFWMFHGQSAFELGFNANADMVADNQSDHSLMALFMVHDHIRKLIKNFVSLWESQNSVINNI